MTDSLRLIRILDDSLVYDRTNIQLVALTVWTLMISCLVVFIVLRLKLIISGFHRLTLTLNQIMDGDDECEINITKYDDKYLDQI